MMSVQQKGFTLIESIVTIVIVGIVAATVSLIIGGYLENYHDTSRRNMMQTAAQLAIERISREVRHALPNSICVYNGAACVSTPQDKLYFASVKDAGYYQDTNGTYPDGVTIKRALPVTPSSSTLFDAVSGSDLRAAVNDFAVVYNINNASIYNGNNTAKISALTPMNVDGVAGDDIVRIQIANTAFPLHSPKRRFHVVKPYSILFYLQGTNLYWGKGADDFINPATAAESHLLLENISSLSFSFSPGTSQRAGLLHIDLTVEKEGEQIHLIHEAHVYNVP